ncbi:MAG: hypothetical protein JM58_19015 [Peptococcaceae bacterium BICA1-8]|nr:MAG: hypothetical protein JM58_19015 [Peptococcaceae bacterium BICA1-8]
MVQIGNIHIGKSNTATQPKIDIGTQPTRSPKSVKITTNVNDSSLINDQLIFESIRDGCVAAIEKNLRNAIAILNNDSLRVMFLDFVKEEANVMLNCCKYGKLKGWLPIYPTFKAD